MRIAGFTTSAVSLQRSGLKQPAGRRGHPTPFWLDRIGAQRGLSAAELALLTESLESLRDTAQAETQAMELNRGLVS